MRKIAVFGLLLVLLSGMVFATNRALWTDTFTDASNLQNISGKVCGAGLSNVDWTTVQWTDDSANTTMCVDTVGCRTSGDGSTWSGYSNPSVTSGNSVALSGKYISCQLNLTNHSTGTFDGCNISGFSATCGGYNEQFTATDAPTSAIDLLITIVVVVVGFGTIIGLILFIGWVRKNTKGGFKLK